MVDPLPPTWTPDSTVRFTAVVIEQPNQTETKTIIRSGIWVISLPGYAEIIPGSLVQFVGKVKKTVLLSKTIKIEMKDPTFEVREPAGERELGVLAQVRMGILGWRQKMVLLLQKWLPTPMSSLAAGILLGVKEQMPREFYQQLVNTGTLHIVAASGFNVMVVAGVLMKLTLLVLRRGSAIGVGVVGIWLYVMLAGATAAVVRAGVMGSLTLVAYGFGRPAEAKRLLWVTVVVMLLVQPLMIVDIGFQLSVAATAGLLYIESWMGSWPRHKFLVNYLYPTLAASVASAPIILWHFGRVAWISPVANMLILPVVPLIMLLTALTLVSGLPVAWLTYVPLWWVVLVVRWLG